MFRFQFVEFKKILHVEELAITKQTTLITGPSGGGKTTMLRLMNKLISPTAGVLTYRGEDLSTVPSVLHRRRVMMLSQLALLFDGTVRENLAMGFHFQVRVSPGDDAFRKALEQVQLPKALDDDTARFSGGEKQRLALARVILLEPEVFLLDEPAASLDDDTEERILHTLAVHVKSTGQSIIMVTHSRQVAEPISDEVVTIEGGRVIEKRSLR